jgi:predicted P-loop ATPase
MQARCAWGLEVAELAGMTRGEIERIKAFITRRVDRFRPPYGRTVVEVPRQSVLVGTTNSESYLKDETGGRRFLPIRCGSIALEKLSRDRDQLWAEAAHLHKRGARWWLAEPLEVALAREQQADRYVGDVWDSDIAEYVETKTDTSVGEILSDVFFIEKGRQTQVEMNRVVRHLVSKGWTGYWARTPTKGKRYRRENAL